MDNYGKEISVHLVLSTHHLDVLMASEEDGSFFQHGEDRTGELFFPVMGDFRQRIHCLSVSLMLWLFIFSMDVGYWQSLLQSLKALLRVTFIWRMLKHGGNNYKQQLQDIFHPKGHRKKP